MPQDYEVCGYQYRAAEYCPAHVVEALLINRGLEGHGLSYIPEEALDRMARFEGIDRMDEYTFDSDDFPKAVFGYQAEGADSHCETCGEHLRVAAEKHPYWSSIRTTEARWGRS